MTYVGFDGCGASHPPPTCPPLNKGLGYFTT